MASDTQAVQTAPAAAPGRRHLHEVDVVRLLTFASVVGVHVVAATVRGDSGAAGAVLMLLHFTRETFFVLSAFVLVHVHQHRQVRVGNFWARRFPPIGLPYLVWTLVYWLTTVDAPLLSASSLHALGTDLWSGGARYHLYFLLVSLQLYLVFPLLLALVRRTAGHHALLFTASLVLELAVLSAVHWGHPGSGFWQGAQDRAYFLLPTYEFYFVAGALAAVHLERLHAWVRAHGRTVTAVTAAAAALDEVVYVVHLQTGDPVGRAVDPLQPVMLLWSVVVSGALYALGCAYAERRARGGLPRLGRLVAEGSVVSFGVYLVHPLLISDAIVFGLRSDDPVVPQPLSALLAWLFVVVASVAVVEVLVRTPFSYAVTGRHRREVAPSGAGPA